MTPAQRLDLVNTLRIAALAGGLSLLATAGGAALALIFTGA